MKSHRAEENRVGEISLNIIKGMRDKFGQEGASWKITDSS